MCSRSWLFLTGSTIKIRPRKILDICNYKISINANNIMEGNKSLTLTRRSVATTGQVPVPREEGLAISVGDNIYYYAGRAKGNILLDEVTGSVLHVFNTKSASWTKIETSPPRARCGDIYVYGTAVGTDIWIYDSGTWLCFDTIQQKWRKVDQLNTKKVSYSSLHLSSIGVIGQSLYYYDGNMNSFEKKVYQVNTATNQISTSDEEGFGEHPQERHDTFMLAVSNDILVLYAPFASYEKEQAKKRGELFYYDLNEAKWARVKQLKDEPALNLHAYYYVGRIGSALYFSPTRDTDPNEWWTLDLATSTWEKKIITGDKPKLFDNYATVVGDKIYCWMEDGTMTVVDIHNMPSSDQQRQVDEQLAQMAHAALSQIKRPGTVIDEYIPEPIIIDADLDPAQPNNPEIHPEIAKEFSSIFPLIDEQKIIENTVAARFEPGQVYMHKNYLHYLTLAWANHFSVILSPDIIFYTVLCEIADEILTDPDAFRHLFTNSTEKKGIMSFVHDETKIDVKQLIQGISKNLPVDPSIFTADFSCSTPESRLAMQSAFCEAMSAYYYYMSTMCGIPRVKVLGTKQDWETLEHKLHRMRTEVFNQDGSANQKMSLYIKAAEEQTRKIHTTRDPAFWKDMFAIDTCMSGHTDVVEGWINAFYRKGYARKENGMVKFYGDDFYNYKAHISTVKWQHVESQRNFELKSGLLYSNVVSDESPEDKKHPWLEPQFCHVIVETDGGKMSPEAFKKFIETTLKGRNKKLMLQFFEVLKDDPIEFVKDRGVKEVNFKLELVRRLIEHWKQEYLKTGQGSSESKSNQDAFDALKEKIIEYLKINTNITQVHNSSKLSELEHEIIDICIGNPKIEELTVYLTTQESIEKVAQFLLHPSCNLKTLTIGRVDNYYGRDEDDEDDKKVSPPDYSIFADALLKTKAPLDKLSFDSINDTDIATSVAELCRRPNGLKYFNVVSLGSRNSHITEILIRGQVESKTLREISLSGVERKEVVVEGRKRWVDAETDELKECIAKNMPLNPSLEAIGYIRFKLHPVEQSKALSIPSLKSIKFTDLQDLSFLDTTTKLESIHCTLNCLSEQLTYLQKFVMREDCPLKILSVEKSTLYHGAAGVLGKGLVHNKSITEFNLRKSSIKLEDDALALVESILEWLEKPYCKLKKLNLSEMPLKFEGANLQRLLNVLKTNKTLKQIDVNITFTMECLPLFKDLVQDSQMYSANFGGTSATKLAGEELRQFVTATMTNEHLVSFRAPFLDYEDYKYPRSLWNNEDFYE